MSEAPLNVLVVDDDEIYRERLVKAFAKRGFMASGAEDHKAAVRASLVRLPDVAVVDLRMPGESGLETVKYLRGKNPAARILILTGYGSIANALNAVRMGATSYLAKPADVDEILKALGLGSDGQQEGSEETADDDEAPTPSLARVEWEHIQRVLEDCEGNISEAARRLGIHRRSLQRKLQKYPPSV